MTPIDNTQGETPTPITDGAVFKLPIAEIPGEEIIVKEFVGAGIARQLERELQQAEAALGEAREQWRMSSVCRELKARNAELEGALREIAAVINERGTGHVVMYSDRMTGFLPRINQLLSAPLRSAPVAQLDASGPANGGAKARGD